MNEANEATCQDDGRRQNGVVLEIVALATLTVTLWRRDWCLWSL